mmetsp:Transcript_18480/g.51376  ORF Transcript_18480/g.51376 Transcript_18480/m.51376 type:complete len:96 (-) Transcript_18480:637-924(-)
MGALHSEAQIVVAAIACLAPQEAPFRWTAHKVHLQGTISSTRFPIGSMNVRCPKAGMHRRHGRKRNKAWPFPSMRGEVLIFANSFAPPPSQLHRA